MLGATRANALALLAFASTAWAQLDDDDDDTDEDDPISGVGWFAAATALACVVLLLVCALCAYHLRFHELTRELEEQEEERPPAEAVVIITDVGEDLDDEMALLMARFLVDEQLIEVKAVIANLQPSGSRARLARGTLDLLRLQGVPVGSGTDGGAPKAKDHFSETASYLPPADSERAHDIEPGRALLHRTLSDAPPKSITLLCISSFKDAALFMRDNGVLCIDRIKRVVVMGGVSLESVSACEEVLGKLTPAITPASTPTRGRIPLPTSAFGAGVMQTSMADSSRRTSDRPSAHPSEHNPRNSAGRESATVTPCAASGSPAPLSPLPGGSASGRDSPTTYDPHDPPMLVPDTAHNNAFDMRAASYLYEACQRSAIPLTVVTRYAAYAAPVRREIYDYLAQSGSPIGWRLRKVQRDSIERLWRRACAPDGDAGREGLPARCDREWFSSTFCKGRASDRGSEDPIWDLIVSFNMYDVLALVACCPTLATVFFDPLKLTIPAVPAPISPPISPAPSSSVAAPVSLPTEEAERATGGGAGGGQQVTHEVIGVSAERTGVRDGFGKDLSLFVFQAIARAIGVHVRSGERQTIVLAVHDAQTVASAPVLLLLRALIEFNALECAAVLIFTRAEPHPVEEERPAAAAAAAGRGGSSPPPQRHAAGTPLTPPQQGRSSARPTGSRPTSASGTPSYAAPTKSSMLSGRAATPPPTPPPTESSFRKQGAPKSPKTATVLGADGVEATRRRTPMRPSAAELCDQLGLTAQTSVLCFDEADNGANGALERLASVFAKLPSGARLVCATCPLLLAQLARQRPLLFREHAECVVALGDISPDASGLLNPNVPASMQPSDADEGGGGAGGPKHERAGGRPSQGGDGDDDDSTDDDAGDDGYSMAGSLGVSSSAIAPTAVPSTRNSLSSGTAVATAVNARRDLRILPNAEACLPHAGEAAVILAAQCEALGVPLRLVPRSEASRASLPSALYDQLAAVGGGTGWAVREHVRAAVRAVSARSQRARIAKPARGAAASWPAELDAEWFAEEYGLGAAALAQVHTGGNADPDPSAAVWAGATAIPLPGVAMLLAASSRTSGHFYAATRQVARKGTIHRQVGQRAASSSGLRPFVATMVAKAATLDASEFTAADARLTSRRHTLSVPGLGELELTDALPSWLRPAGAEGGAEEEAGAAGDDAAGATTAPTTAAAAALTARSMRAGAAGRLGSSRRLLDSIRLTTEKMEDGGAGGAGGAGDEGGGTADSDGSAKAPGLEGGPKTTGSRKLGEMGRKMSSSEIRSRFTFLNRQLTGDALPVAAAHATGLTAREAMRFDEILEEALTPAREHEGKMSGRHARPSGFMRVARKSRKSDGKRGSAYRMYAGAPSPPMQRANSVGLSAAAAAVPSSPSVGERSARASGAPVRNTSATGSTGG